MKILVAIKQVVDANEPVRLHENGCGRALDSTKKVINPFCEVAVEAAVQLKEGGTATEVVVVTLGPDSAIDSLRSALALGADRALHLQCDGPLLPVDVARSLNQVVAEEAPQLVLLGKQDTDGDHQQTGQRLSALLDWPMATAVSALTIDDGKVVVGQETMEGSETLAMMLPAVLTTDLRLNEPRYATLPNLLKAKRKPLQTIPMESPRSRQQVLSATLPPTRPAGIALDSVEALAAQLIKEVQA